MHILHNVLCAIHVSEGGLNSFPGTFHHIGLACHSIEDEAASVAAIGYTAEGPSIDDPIQKVRIQFFSGTGPRIELIAPLAADSPVSGVLKRGTKFYHLAYEIKDFEKTIDVLRKLRFHPIGPIAPAIAFGMRRIVFLMSETGMLLELIELRVANLSGH